MVLKFHLEKPFFTLRTANFVVLICNLLHNLTHMIHSFPSGSRQSDFSYNRVWPYYATYRPFPRWGKLFHPKESLMNLAAGIKYNFYLFSPRLLIFKSRPNKWSKNNAFPSSAVFFPFSRSDIKLVLNPVYSDNCTCV